MVRCADCGLLALRVGRTVPTKLRVCWNDQKSHVGVAEATLQCVAEAFTLQDEAKLATSRMDETAKVIEAERPCEKFV